MGLRTEFWSTSSIGLIRKSNQDAVGCFPDRQLFVVCDGMGGLQEGERASRSAVTVIGRYFRTEAPQGDGNAHTEWTHTLSEAISSANGELFEEGLRISGDAENPALGTTVVALKLDLTQSRAWWAHVGDSRLYRSRQDQLMLFTADHTMYGERYAYGSVIPVDLPHTNSLLQAVGVRANVRARTGGADVKGGDIFLLCTDGVSGMVDPATIGHELLTPRPLKETAESLIHLALESGGRDNASLVLVRIIDS